MNDDFKNPEKRDGASKSTVKSVLDGVAAGGSKVLSLVSGLLAAALILYSGYVLYDTLYTQNQASAWNYADYKPEIIDDPEVPLSGVDLSTINNDYRGWLTMYETTIDYPVMQGENDLYYASHNIYKEESLTGAIYLAAGNTRDFSDSYNLIYGHHMDNGAMFGILDDFAGQDFFGSHREGILVTESGIYDLYTFAVMKTDAYEGTVYTAGGDRMEEVISYIRKPDSKSKTLIFDEDALDGAEKIVALSTCIRAETTGRLVVFATMTQKDMMKVSVTGYEGVYDGENHQLSVSVNYPDNTTVEYSLDGGRTWTTELPGITDVGSVTVMVRATNPIYGTAAGTATLEVTPAPVTVTVNESSKVYGESDPAFSATVTGTLNGDTVDYTVSRPGESTDVNAGNYPDALVAEGSTIQGNYSVTYVPAAFTITRSYALAVTPEGERTGEGESARYELTVTYDGNAHTLSGIPNYPDGTTVQYSVDGGTTWTTNVPSLTNVGTENILIRATNPNYYDANATGVLRVVPAPVTVSANNASKVYGAADPAFTAQVSGLIGNDTIAYTVSRVGNDEAVGTYPGVIVAGGETAQGNYTVSYSAADFTITNAGTLVISANGYTGVYDGNTHYVAATANIPDGTTIEYSTDGGATWTTTPPGITNAGTIDVLIRASNPNYDTAVASVQLQVIPAAVTVTVNNAVKEYRAQDPVFTAVVSGVLGGDTITYTISRTGNNEDVGVYNDVIVATGDAAQGNYSVVYVPGDLTITPANGINLRVTGYTGVYDGNSHFAEVAGNLPEGTTVEYSTDGGRTWTTTPPGITNVGAQNVTVRATNPNYNTVTATVQLQVTAARVTVTANSATKRYGSADPVFTASVSGLLNGDTIEYTVSRLNNEEDVGVYERVIVPSGAANQGNYSVTYVPADFTITNISSLVISATGYTGVYDGNTHYVSASVNIPDGTTIEYSTDGGRTWSRIPPGILNAGTMNVMIRATNPNFETVTATVQMRVEPATVTVRVNNAIKRYGAQDPEFTAQVSGLRNGDTIEYTIRRIGNNEDIGTYNDVLRATGAASQGNYTVVYVPGDFTIGPSGELALIATGYTGVYDGNSHFADASVNIPEGTTIEYSTDGGRTWTTTPPGITDAGTMTVMVRATNPNYNTVTATVRLLVRRAAVTVTVNNAGKVAGEDDPEFTAEVSGLIDEGEIVYTISRSDEEEVGVYAGTIVASGNRFQGNYEVTYVPGDFEITAPPVEPETEVIEDDETPLAGLVTVFQPSGGSHGIRVWALINLICLILTIYLLIPLLHLAAKFGRKKLMKQFNESKEALRNAAVLGPEQQMERAKIEQAALANRKDAQAGGPVTEEEFNGAVETLYYRLKKFLLRFRIGIVLEIIVAAAAIVAFVLTEDMRLPMVLIDRWTLLMLLILFLNWIIDIRLIRYWSKKQEEDEDNNG